MFSVVVRQLLFPIQKSARRGQKKRSTSIPLLPFIHKKRNETLERNSRSPGMKLFNKQLWIFEFIAHHQIRSLADVSFPGLSSNRFDEK